MAKGILVYFSFLFLCFRIFSMRVREMRYPSVSDKTQIDDEMACKSVRSLVIQIRGRRKLSCKMHCKQPRNKGTKHAESEKEHRVENHLRTEWASLVTLFSSWILGR